MKKFLGLIIILLLCFLAGCASAYKNGADSGIGGGYYDPSYSLSGKATGVGRSDDYSGEGMSGEVPGEGETEDIEDPLENVKLQAGQITAAATFDNDKYTFWKSLLVRGQEEDGIFKDYNDRYEFKTANRITLAFPKGTYAKAYLVEDEKVLFIGVTDANGICYIFAPSEKESYNLHIEYLDKDNNKVSFDDTVSGDKEYDLETLSVQKDLIELMLVIDATGSMGDEMRYLQVELVDVINKIKKANANISIRLGALVYRDKGDQYVVKSNDFTTDIASQVQFLSIQVAAGGGDFEEAVQEAYIEALKCSWTSSNSTKILIHVADAPSHDSDISSWNSSILKLASMGVRVITVASSGIDKKTEYLFRCQSLLTNGVYVHITNDSGIGGDHIEATTEEKEEVELLNDCLVRLINGIHTGTFSEPINWRQSQSVPAE